MYFILLRRLSFSATFVLALFSALSVFAQFPVSIKLDAKSPDKKFTAVTLKGVKYRITVSGTYSQWPQYNGFGVDAAYVYDVPQAEIDALRWPPKEITIPVVGTKVKILDIPHWVGDNTTYPPQNLLQYIPGLQVKLNFRNYLGFRINGLPLDPAPVLESVTHRYQVEMIGDGNPFTFQILDSTYSIPQEKVIGRYEDNSGYLTVVVEEVRQNDVNICSLDPILDKDGKIIGIKLQASILQIDSNSTTGKRNVLTDARQLAIYENGRFICPDSIRCGDRSKSIAVGFVIDRSGSMVTPISLADTTIRINAMKKAYKNFIGKMQAKDEAMVISFSEDVRVDQTWTSDTTALRNAVEGLFPDAATAFYQALVQGLDSVRKHPNPRKAIIALTDGVNNRSVGSEAVFAKIRELKAGNLPIYVIALGLDRTNPEDVKGLDTLKMIADSSKGKLYEVGNAKALDSIYIQLNKDIASDECCTVYFKITPCKDKADSVRTVTIFYPVGDSVVAKTVQYRTDCASKIVGVFEEKNSTEITTTRDPFEVSEAMPNPNYGIARINYDLPISGSVRITLTDILGNSRTVFQDTQDSGKHFIDMYTQDLASGAYHTIITLNGVSVTRKVIVAK